MIKKVMCALILGVLGSLFVIEHDGWASTHVGTLFTTFFSKQYHCTMTATVESCSVWSPTLCCSAVVVTAPDSAGWDWSASQLAIGFSWWHFLLFGIVNLSVHITDLTIRVPSLQSLQQLQDHLRRIWAPTTSIFVCTIDAISIQHALLQCDDTASSLHGTLTFNYGMRRIDGVYRSLVTLADGSYTYDSVEVLKNLRGSILIDNEITGKCSCVIPRLPEQQNTCFIQGSWVKEEGRCSLVNAERTFAVDLLHLTKTDTGFSAQATLQSTAAQLAALAGFSETERFGGIVNGKGTVAISNGVGELQAEVIGSHCSYAGQSVGTSCIFNGKKCADRCEGTLSILSGSQEQCTGTWNYSCTTGSGMLHIHNGIGFTLPTTTVWESFAHDMVVDAAFNAQRSITGTYQWKAHHKYKKNSAVSTGTFSITDTKGRLDGICGAIQYEADFDLTSCVPVRSFVCTNAAHDKLVICKGSQHNQTQIKAAVSIDFLHTLIETLYEYDLQGTGMLLIEVECGKILKVALQLSKGTIRIAPIYTVITGMRAHLTYDQEAKTVTIADLVCLLHKGTVTLKHAIVVHEGSTISSLYAPCIIKNCPFMFHPTIFTHISGQLTTSYNKGNLPRVIGSILVEKAHIKENIFSDTFQQRIADISQTAIPSADNDIACDVTIETIAPLKVDTPFLKADARMALRIGNTVSDPHIAGELTIASGSLLFPYRPLHITKGVITMTAQHLQDPLIELVAQNQVRNHAITMHVTGSLSQHHIMFESTPTLTEQQIIALLLVGSEHESLNIVMPTLIMTNVASLLFGTINSESLVERALKRLIKPFKDVHIIPRFSDQTSRGGLRGAIDIEVNDRVRALIQKNFSLTEDTRFELEYQASDDIRVRAIRDEHRDMGAEVEMRWKF